MEFSEDIWSEIIPYLTEKNFALASRRFAQLFFKFRKPTNEEMKKIFETKNLLALKRHFPEEIKVSMEMDDSRYFLQIEGKVQTRIKIDDEPSIEFVMYLWEKCKVDFLDTTILSEAMKKNGYFWNSIKLHFRLIMDILEVGV